MKNLKVVIAAGGDGTRLGGLNPKSKPKSLLFFEGRPLISYQLDRLIDFSFDIFLSFTSDEQIEEFQQYVHEGLIPEYDYFYGLHDPLDHQRDLFRNKSTQKFIEGSDFLFTHGDLIVKSPLFEELYDSYIKNNCSVIIKEKAKAKDEYQFITNNSFITKIVKTKNPEWRYGGLFIIEQKDQANWLKMCHNEPFRSLEFFELSLLDSSKIFVLDLLQNDLVLNINTPAEYFIAEKYFQIKDRKSVLKYT